MPDQVTHTSLTYKRCLVSSSHTSMRSALAHHLMGSEVEKLSEILIKTSSTTENIVMPDGLINPTVQRMLREPKNGGPSAIYYDENDHSTNTKQAAFPPIVSKAPRMLQVVLARDVSKSTSTRALGRESSRGARRSTRRIGPRSNPLKSSKRLI